MRKIPLLVVGAALLLGAAAPATPPEPTETTASRTYPYSEESVWGRILATSARKSMVVRRADRTDGVISVDREIVTPQTDIFANTIFDWADCGRGGAFERAETQRVEVDYAVRHEPQDGATTVTLTGRFQELRKNVASQKTRWVNCASTGALERELLDTFYYDYAG
jgi:hypothetical protein